MTQELFYQSFTIVPVLENPDVAAPRESIVIKPGLLLQLAVHEARGFSSPIQALMVWEIQEGTLVSSPSWKSVREQQQTLCIHQQCTKAKEQHSFSHRHTHIHTCIHMLLYNPHIHMWVHMCECLCVL